MPKLTPEQARALAASFHDLASSVADYRFRRWDDLTPKERSRLESVQWTLLNASSDFSTQAIELTLDSSGPSVARLVAATAALEKKMQALETAGKVLAIAALAVKLAAAIVTENPAAIASALGDIAGAV